MREAASKPASKACAQGHALVLSRKSRSEFSSSLAPVASAIICDRRGATHRQARRNACQEEGPSDARAPKHSRLVQEVAAVRAGAHVHGQQRAGGAAVLQAHELRARLARPFLPLS